MVVLAGGAVSYERGTPVQTLPASTYLLFRLDPTCFSEIQVFPVRIQVFPVRSGPCAPQGHHIDRPRAKGLQERSDPISIVNRT